MLKCKYLGKILKLEILRSFLLTFFIIIDYGKLYFENLCILDTGKFVFSNKIKKKS